MQMKMVYEKLLIISITVSCAMQLTIAGLVVQSSTTEEANESKEFSQKEEGIHETVDDVGKQTEQYILVRTPDLKLVPVKVSEIVNTSPEDPRARIFRYFLNSDPIFTKLNEIIKYWAKVRDLDQTTPIDIFSIMVIFFLQQKHLFPPISKLQENVKPIIENHWNIAFEKIQSNETNNNLSDLLIEFFRYYANFDFENDVISPYAGIPLKKEEFDNYETLAEEFDLYKLNVRNNVTTPIVLNSLIKIQDIFEHDRNVAVNVSDVMADKIITAIRSVLRTRSAYYDYEELLKSLLQQ